MFVYVYWRIVKNIWGDETMAKATSRKIKLPKIEVKGLVKTGETAASTYIRGS